VRESRELVANRFRARPPVDEDVRRKSVRLDARAKLVEPIADAARRVLVDDDDDRGSPHLVRTVERALSARINSPKVHAQRDQRGAT
jgi:hypothetical protein